MPKISEVLGMSESEFESKHFKYSKELEALVRSETSKTKGAEKLIGWLDKSDATLKMIVILDMLDRAARMVDTVLKFAKTLKATN